jgi:flavin reductase (DIM6/NTAB) family NADH-FMN oxidoreductase RutF
MSTFDARALRNAFGTFMTGVTVVTAYDDNDAPLGFTANSFSSVSLDPPLVLVCLANTSQNFDTLVHAKGFAVNILAEDQINISNTFAQRVEDRFAAVDWQRGPVGSPILSDTSAWFDCTMHKTVDAGDHVILIGQVGAFDSTTKPGLGYARGAYVTPSTTTDALDRTPNLVVSALIERENHVLLVKDKTGALALPELAVRDEGASSAVKKLIATTGLQAQPGFIYSVFEDEDHPKLGEFVPLTPKALEAVTDPAIRTMLNRFASETAIGNYGIYYGDQHSGEVRPMKEGN